MISFTIAAILAMIIEAPLGQIRSTIFSFVDLRSFYCSASVARAGFDPYRVGPIGACERALIGMEQSNFVLPAPLPGLAIALFEPLSALSFPAAAIIWCALLAAVYFALAISLAKLMRWRYMYVLVALLPLAAILPLILGQLVPIAVMLLVMATLALRKNLDGAAALLTAAATIEPHIGLPVCVALFLNRPRSRPFLIVSTFLIAAITAHIAGLSGFVEYLQRVLPEHIASEGRYDDQYSLTYLLSWLRLPMRDAIAIGQDSYWLLAAAGIWAANRLTRASGDARFLLFVPMAFSVIGGPFVHAEHLLAAIPLAILLVVTALGRTRVLFVFALTLVAWPAKFALLLLGIPGSATIINNAYVPQSVGPLPLLAEAAWAARIEPNAGNLFLLEAKVPTWIGLLILLTAITLRVSTLMRATPAIFPGYVSRAVRATQCREKNR